MLGLIVILSTLSLGEAGIRCSIGGDTLCTFGCVILGQTSGICDSENVCHCSEQSISLDDIKALVPSRCDLGESFCVGTCNAVGRRGGSCANNEEGNMRCTCDEEFLTASEFSLCAAESTCRIDCQARGSATGRCDGWKCTCQSKGDDQSSG